MCRSLGRALGVAILVLAAGCGGPYRVAGTVHLNGEPVSKAKVVAYPDNGRPPVMADTDADGAFVLTADAGDYKVVVIPYDPEAIEKLKGMSGIDLSPKEVRLRANPTMTAPATRKANTSGPRRGGGGAPASGMAPIGGPMPAPGPAPRASSPASPASPSSPMGTGKGIPAQYTNLGTTPLRLKVPPEGLVEYDLTY
jgi:hypothetical protein